MVWKVRSGDDTFSIPDCIISPHDAYAVEASGHRAGLQLKFMDDAVLGAPDHFRLAGRV